VSPIPELVKARSTLCRDAGKDHCSAARQPKFIEAKYLSGNDRQSASYFDRSKYESP
jgi:hypothetical protein